jgi:hypothetical protein
MAKKLTTVIETAPVETVAATPVVEQTVEQGAPNEDQPGNEPEVEHLPTYEETLAQVQTDKKPLTYPLVKVPCKTTDKDGDWEAEFTGQAVGRLVDVKFSQSASGSPQIWLRGVIVRDYPADLRNDPEGQAANPNGYCYSLRLRDAEHGGDEQGMEGFRSVVGFPFVTAVTLTGKAEGKETSGAEMAVNTLATFGYRGLGPVDFVPAKGEPSVLAQNLPVPEYRGDKGMDSEVLLEFTYKKADGNFPARIQLKKVTVLEYRATVDEAALLQEELLDLFAARLKGRVDTRKTAVEGTAERMGLRKPRGAAAGAVGHVESGQGRTAAIGAVATQTTTNAGQPAGTGTATEPVQTAPTPGKCGKPIHGGKFCNRLPEHDKPSKDAEGKVVGATPCSTIPF